MKYDAKHFIKKFEAIPENKWIVNSFGNNKKHCARGHCGARSGFVTTDEDLALQNLIYKWFNPCCVITINDCELSLGSHPKERILNALYNIKGAGS